MKRINSLRRIGLLMTNIGHTAIYSDNSRMAVTLLHLSETHIVDIKGQDKCDYNSVILGTGDFKNIAKPQFVDIKGQDKCDYNSVILGTGDFKNIAKPQLEYLKKKGINNKCKLYESRLNDLSGIECGKKVGINHFVVGQYLDITGYSIGKGFAGVMKRHNFSGLGASHGVSIAHRSQGSTGQCQDPGRVFKGKKMAGHLGNSRITAQNMKILSIDHENSIIAVKGNNVPGFKNSYVFVRDAVKKSLHKDVPFPVGLLLDVNDDASNLVS